MKCPTEKQYEKLRMLGSGSAGLAWKRREVEPLLRHEWVTAELSNGFYSWVRITPTGLEALARAVAKYGLPDLGPKPQTERRVCAECGSDRYRFVLVDARTALPALAERVLALEEALRSLASPNWWRVDVDMGGEYTTTDWRDPTEAMAFAKAAFKEDAP